MNIFTEIMLCNPQSMFLTQRIHVLDRLEGEERQRRLHIHRYIVKLRVKRQREEMSTNTCPEMDTHCWFY